MTIIDEPLLDEFRGPGICEWCRKQAKAREPHHIRARGRDSGFRLDVRINIIALCPPFSGGEACHVRVHNGGITTKDLVRLVAIREATTVGQIEDVVWFLRRLDKDASPAMIEMLIGRDLEVESATLARLTLGRAGKIELPF